MRRLMELAVAEMRQSGADPRVGAVIAKGETVLSVGRRDWSLHAERAAIEAAARAGHELRGSTLFTTLEPCISFEAKKEPCAELIARVGIGAVYIGRYDPNPVIHRSGWKFLRDAGVKLHDFDIDLRDQIDELNRDFASHFASGVGPTGGAKFDYHLNGGNFEIRFSATDERSIMTSWTQRGQDSIYAYAVRPVTVALARYARDFAEIDDPEAFNFTYTVPIAVGEIAVFKSDVGAVLVRVEEVEAGPITGAAKRWVKLKYEVRPK